MRQSVIVTVLIALLAGCGEDEQDIENGIIIPGEQAAGIKLGDRVAEVKDIYGEPDGVYFSHSYWKYLDAGIAFHIMDDRVTDIYIKIPNKSKTPGDNGIGSLASSVEKEFGDPEDIDYRWSGMHYWYYKKGIGFRFNNSDQVVEIFIFERH